jgi:hypothetical protein
MNITYHGIDVRFEEQKDKVNCVLIMTPMQANEYFSNEIATKQGIANYIVNEGFVLDPRLPFNFIKLVKQESL